MKLLPSDFQITKYGVTARLVTEDDAEFITKLRADDRLGRYIHASDGDIEKQKEWTKEYKKREVQGLDYYFIIYKNEEPYALSRLYNIDWTHLLFTKGSWICKYGTEMSFVIASSVITNYIAYDILGLKINIFDVRKDNTKVLRFHRNIMKSIQYAETDLDYLFISTPETRRQSKLLQYLEID